MTSNLEPPAIVNSQRNKICFNKKCPAPFNMTNMDRHASHLSDVYEVDELVRKLHDRNQKNKEELGHIQGKLYERIEKNENAIMELRNQDQSVVIASLSYLKEQSESLLGNPLIGRNNLESYDNIFFSTKRLRFEQLDEPYMKSFKEVFKKLTDVQIFTQCQISCPNHNVEIVNAFDLQANVPKGARLLCVQDRREGVQNFQSCESILNNYCQQEKYFEKLFLMKELIFSLRFHLDCITNKILTTVQGLISKNFQYFSKNQQDFNRLYQCQGRIPKETYENLAEFLSQQAQNMPFKQEIINDVDRCDGILNQIKDSIMRIRSEFEAFLNNLKPSIIKITAEIIKGQQTKVYHLEAENNATLLDLFNYLKDENKWNCQITQAEIKIDNLIIQQSQRPPRELFLRNNNFIEFTFINQ